MIGMDSRHYYDFRHWNRIANSIHNRVVDSEANRHVTGSVVSLCQNLARCSGTRILDIGAGSGALIFLCSKFSKAVGIDVSAGGMFPDFQGGSRYVIASAEYIPFADSSFDVATCVKSLWCFHDPVRCIREAVRTLRPGGFFVMQCWGARQDCKMLTAGPAAVATEDQDVIRPEGVADPFEYDEIAMRHLFDEAGLLLRTVHRLVAKYEVTTSEEYWRQVEPLACTAAIIRRSLGAAASDRADKTLNKILVARNGKLPLAWNLFLGQRRG